VLIKWKSGYVAYWVRGAYYLTIGLILGALLCYGVVRWVQPFDMVRHSLSTVGIVCFLANFPFALRRRRWIIRFGHQAKWLKAHWMLGGVGTVCVVVHSAMDPASWSGWVALAVVAGILVSGVLTHFTRRYFRRAALRIHFVSAVALVAGFAAHGLFKMHHPEFPLETVAQNGTKAHDVPCAQCHEERNQYDRYGCTSCHIHSSEAVLVAHETHGVYGIDRCLDCHKAVIEGETYFTGGGGRAVYGNVFDFSE
jgi:hypothetical protein